MTDPTGAAPVEPRRDEDGDADGAAQRLVPPWLWACGGGCLLLLLLAVGVGGCVVSRLAGWKDPERQLARLAETLPVDELPPDVAVLMGWHLVYDLYLLEDRDTDGDGPDRGYVIVVLHEEDADEARALRDDVLDPGVTDLPVLGSREDVEPVTIEVQGRALEGVRFVVTEGFEEDLGLEVPGRPPDDRGAGPDGAPRAGGDGGGPLYGEEGTALVLDVTPAGEEGLLLFLILPSRAGREPVSEEYARELLAPFHVGPER